MTNLLLFKVMIRLKVNFHKNMIVGTNIHKLWLLEVVEVLNCRVD